MADGVLLLVSRSKAWAIAVNKFWKVLCHRAILQVYQDNIYDEGSKFYSLKSVMKSMGEPFSK